MDVASPDIVMAEGQAGRGLDDVLGVEAGVHVLMEEGTGTGSPGLAFGIVMVELADARHDAPGVLGLLAWALYGQLSLGLVMTGAMMLTLSETGRIDQLSDGLCRSTELEAVRSRLYAWCAAGLAEIVRRRAQP